MPVREAVELESEDILLVTRFPQAPHDRCGLGGRREISGGRNGGHVQWIKARRGEAAEVRDDRQCNQGQPATDDEVRVDLEPVPEIVATGKIGVCGYADTVSSRKLHCRDVEADPAAMPWTNVIIISAVLIVLPHAVPVRWPGASSPPVHV